MRNKKIFTYIILFILLVLYLLIGEKVHFYIPCPIHFITGFFCPGCGVTRMLISILKGDFYQAFRYNPLLFIFLPFIFIYFLEILISKIKGKKSIMEKIPDKVFYILIFVFIVYGVLRNIDMFSFLEPTVIR